MALSKKKLALGGCGTTLLLIVAALAWVHHLVFDRTPGEFLDSKGLQVYYTVEGNEKADPVILIHGLAAHSDINWRRPGINDVLASDFKVVAFDLRGHGLSGRPHAPAEYGIETVEDITRLMDHLGIQKAHLAGYSLGGFIGLKFATLHPERCLSLAICASGWKDPMDPEPIRSPYKDNPETRLPPDERKHRKVLEQMQQGQNQIPTNQANIFAWAMPEDFDPLKQARDYFGDQVVDREAIRALKKSLFAFSVTGDELKALTVPTLCLMGQNDGLKPYALDLKEAMPQAELVLIDGVNHVTTVLDDEFQDRLHNFFLAHRQTKP